MRNFTLITVLLFCSLRCVSFAVSKFQTAEVLPGKEVTLLCSNFSSSLSQIIWFRVTKGSEPSCVSFMFKPHEPATFCHRFQNGKFETSTNISTVFLKIKQVNLSDSGLYFCGYYVSGNPVIVDATHLEVQDVFDVITKLLSMILGGVTLFLIMIIICLAVKIKKLQKAHVEELNLQKTESQSSDELNYAAVTFRPKTERN
ncbi:uncharacterized protein LOC115023827 [Cottoperca gobio]|uniref:Uncharacterized protein LOC115023827 n=1 Tax=Cottoperca gobio TaxID=56716 RepID=A0A6J2RNA7_COTGO|nr:uncharacterized protein LOC115023827 [Cottoperca gobio]